MTLTHWGPVKHICVSKLTIIGSDNGLSPGQRQAITWTNTGILLIRPLGTNFSEIVIKIHIFLLKKMHFKMLFAKRRPFCLGLNVLTSLLDNHRKAICLLNKMCPMAKTCDILHVLLTDLQWSPLAMKHSTADGSLPMRSRMMHAVFTTDMDKNTSATNNNAVCGEKEVTTRIWHKIAIGDTKKIA